MVRREGRFLCELILFSTDEPLNVRNKPRIGFNDDLDANGLFALAGGFLDPFQTKAQTLQSPKRAAYDCLGRAWRVRQAC
jgi:hypothetical protein